MQVDMEEREFAKKTRVIIKFGPGTSTDGMKAGDFYQVIIDPDMVSPGGKFIRFEGTKGEIHGWQRIEAMTVCEVLEELDGEVKDKPVKFRVIV